MALYDAIGRTYDTTRKADPDLTLCLARLLNLKPGARYLDVGCGTGNYTVALQQRGGLMHGVELTSTMIAKAHAKSDQVRWIQGDAEELPFRDGTFQGAIATVTIHHMKNPWRTFEEVFRVMRAGRFVIFTGDHAQMNGYWLREYFPDATAAALKQMPSSEAVVDHLTATGFTSVTTESWEVPRDIQDWFLYAGKYRPEIYLDPNVRAGISFFAQGICTPEETDAGCARLKADIESGRIAEVTEKYRHDLGDYRFVFATKE